MFKVNDNYLKLPGSYLFSTIGKKVSAYSAAHPDKKIIRLGIGDVTQPLISRRTRSLYPTEQNATVAIFRRSSAWTIRSRYVILFTLYTWILMSWQAEPALTIRSPRPGVM